MKLTTITIVIVIIALFGIVRILMRLSKDKIKIRAALVWLVIWSGVGFFSLFPTLLNGAMNLLQMENRLFFITLVGLLILFALVFGLTSELERTNWRVAKLVRENALLKHAVSKQKDESNSNSI